MSSVDSDPFQDLEERYIDTASSLHDFTDEISSGEMPSVCAIDTEADSMHSYETKLCLIQFAVPGQLAIIDPLEIGADGLRHFPHFIDRFDQVWMHGADYDISMFRQTFDWVPRRILDTQIAARLLGAEKFGLANLLESEYGVKLSKQSQKADWSQRPLKEKMLDYAYNDVRYLIDLGHRYLDRLAEVGREDWFLESCDSARESVMNRDEKSDSDRWRITGWGKLSSKGLNLLQHLWQWREEECRRLDRPPFKFVGNPELIRMSGEFERDEVVKPPHFLRPQYVKRLHETIAAAKEVAESDYPKKRLRGNGVRLEINEKDFERIRALRNRRAEEHQIDGTIIATRQVMERLASKNLPVEEKLEGLLEWQRELLSPLVQEYCGTVES